jgi:hypothetical protein
LKSVQHPSVPKLELVPQPFCKIQDHLDLCFHLLLKRAPIVLPNFIEFVVVFLFFIVAFTPVIIIYIIAPHTISGVHYLHCGFLQWPQAWVPPEWRLSIPIGFQEECRRDMAYTLDKVLAGKKTADHE